MELRLARADPEVEHVDLQVTDAQARDHLSRSAVHPAHHRVRAGDQVVRHEGDADVAG